MHVIFDATITQDEFSYAGVGRYGKNIIQTLTKIYPKTRFSVLLFDDRESTLDGELDNYKNVEIVRVGKYRSNNFLNDLWYQSQILPVIKKIQKKDSVYFCPYFWRNFPSNIMPTVLFIHDMNLALFNMYSQKSIFHNLIRKIQYWMTMDKTIQCKQIVFNSKTSLGDYKKYYPNYPKDKITVSYMGVDIDERESSLSNILPADYKKKGYLLYYGGGINRSKNSIGVINGYSEFVKLLNNNTKDIPYLVIAGGKFQDKSQKEVIELYRAVTNYGLEGKVIFSGFYPDEAKYSLLKNSFAFIHLALSEGFGMAPIEALRAKVPTILHKNPVYNELFKEVSLLVDGESKVEVGKVIYDVYKNPKKYSVLIEKGYNLSKKYSWENAAVITYQVLEKALH